MGGGERGLSRGGERREEEEELEERLNVGLEVE